MNPRSAELAELLCNNVSVPWLTQRLQEMIAIPSENPMAGEARPGHREQEIGEYYLERMSELGMRVSQRVVVPGRPNVFGIREGAGDGPTLMLCGHLDTVPTDGYQDAYAVREEGGRIYGRGSCDMKAGLAAYLEVVRLLTRPRSGLMAR